MSILGEVVRREVDAHMMRRDAAIRRCLGQWVSELEPVLIFGPGFHFLGLGHAGSNEIVIPR